MPSYRLEQASTGRATCSNKECKDNKVKIGKGELRHGSWVDSGQFQSWSWRHWGCVTPKIISNINNLIGEGDDKDFDLLDGYEDLPSDLQEKIQKALEQGHVDDEDWKGDVEMNRPGQTGFRVKAVKNSKKAKDADKEEKDDAGEEEEKTPKSTKSKKRGRFQEDEAGKDAETAQPKRPKRKPTGYPKKAPVASDEEDDDDTGFESPESEPEPKPKSSKRGRPAKTSKTPATTSKRGKKTKVAE